MGVLERDTVQASLSYVDKYMDGLFIQPRQRAVASPACPMAPAPETCRRVSTAYGALHLLC